MGSFSSLPLFVLTQVKLSVWPTSRHVSMPRLSSFFPRNNLFRLDSSSIYYKITFVQLCMLIMSHLWDDLILTSYEPMVLSPPFFGKPIGQKPNCSLVLSLYI